VPGLVRWDENRADFIGRLQWRRRLGCSGVLPCGWRQSMTGAALGTFDHTSRLDLVRDEGGAARLAADALAHEYSRRVEGRFAESATAGRALRPGWQSAQMASWWETGCPQLGQSLAWRRRAGKASRSGPTSGMSPKLSR